MKTSEWFRRRWPWWKRVLLRLDWTGRLSTSYWCDLLVETSPAPEDSPLLGNLKKPTPFHDWITKEDK